MTSPRRPGHVTGEGSVVGDVVAGFRITRRLRVNGCTAIYQAVPADRATNDRPSADSAAVVLKTLCRGGSRRIHRRLDNETAMLRHLIAVDVVPRLTATGETEAQRFLAIEWRPGLTLRQLARSSEPATHDFASVAVAVASAVARLHSAGVVHGDLSRRNVLVDGDRVTLIDFEGGCLIDDDFRPLRKTTWAYAAPELAQPMRPDPLTDQYSIAAVLYRQLAGRRHRPVVDGVASDSPEALSISPTRLTGGPAKEWPGLVEVFDTALAVVPGDRFDSMDRFVSALSASLTSPRR